MELRNLKTFLRVAELGSFTRAANEIGYAQSTITAQIQQLENEIGEPLFERIGRRTMLTYTGRRLVTYANEIMRVSEQIRMLGVRSKEVEGSIRVGILESLFVSVLLPLLPEYTTMYPRVTLEVRTSTTEQLFEMLGRNEIDLIYVLKKRIVVEDFVCLHAKPVNVIFVTSPDNPLVQRRSVSLPELLKQPIIMTERIGQCRLALEECAAQLGEAVTPYMQMDNTRVIVELLKNGLGVSFLPEYLVSNELKRGELATIRVDMASIDIWSQLFRHKNKWITPQMEGLIAMIQNTEGLQNVPHIT